MAKTDGLLTGMRLRFVQAWKGNNREAAVAAGYFEKNADSTRYGEQKAQTSDNGCYRQ